MKTTILAIATFAIASPIPLLADTTQLYAGYISTGGGSLSVDFSTSLSDPGQYQYMDQISFSGSCVVNSNETYSFDGYHETWGLSGSGSFDLYGSDVSYTSSNFNGDSSSGSGAWSNAPAGSYYMWVTTSLDFWMDNYSMTNWGDSMSESGGFWSIVISVDAY